MIYKKVTIKILNNFLINKLNAHVIFNLLTFDFKTFNLILNMALSNANKTKLGLFVITTIVLLSMALYLIGSKQNIFGSTIKVSAVFYNVNGLMRGNNVRFNGINVGTVSKLEIVADTSLRAELTIDEDAVKFMSLNSIAAIGSDGLMGNKLVNISTTKENGEPLKEGDVLKTLPLIELDKAMRTLSKTDDNFAIISDNIKNMTQRFNTKNNFWSVMEDTIVANNLKVAIYNLDETTKNAKALTQNLNYVVKDINNGKGIIGKLITDTAIAFKLDRTINNFNSSGDKMLSITSDLNSIIGNVKKGQGTVGSLLTDTTTVHNLNNSILSIDKAATNLDENMEALKHSIFLRNYYKQKEKETKQLKHNN